MKPMLKLAFFWERKKKEGKKRHLVPEWHTGYILTFSQLAVLGRAERVGQGCTRQPGHGSIKRS